MAAVLLLRNRKTGHAVGKGEVTEVKDVTEESTEATEALKEKFKGLMTIREMNAKGFLKSCCTAIR